ncbi:hypothetical protein ACVIGB_006616 [Bradyrhizobium sp. USDA 4341]
MHTQNEDRAALISETWTVMAAARDLGDNVTLLICRRVIEMHLDGREPRMADVAVIAAYFR